MALAQVDNGIQRQDEENYPNSYLSEVGLTSVKILLGDILMKVKLLRLSLYLTMMPAS